MLRHRNLAACPVIGGSSVSRAARAFKQAKTPKEDIQVRAYEWRRSRTAPSLFYPNRVSGFQTHSCSKCNVDSHCCIAFATLPHCACTSGPQLARRLREPFQPRQRGAVRVAEWFTDAMDSSEGDMRWCDHLGSCTTCSRSDGNVKILVVCTPI
jgi:hypothetical protein